MSFMRTYHPMYEKDGGIPAITEVKHSITSSRGCFGSCNFCALAFHHGRVVSSRSHESIVSEAEKIIADKIQRLEAIKIKGKFEYETLNSLSTEARQKLKKIDPETLAQASRIPGISPSDINVLLVLLGR